MKKLLFLFIAFLTLSTLTYASFPVIDGNTSLIENSTILPDLNNNTAETPVYTDWGLFWWCFFVGTLGVHRYMMGDIWQGIVQTLTFGGLYVWWIIDLVRIANGQLSR
jgi:type IV secretory pathway TraG/TraD family ATPase VirD4